MNTDALAAALMQVPALPAAFTADLATLVARFSGPVCAFPRPWCQPTEPGKSCHGCRRFLCGRCTQAICRCGVRFCEACAPGTVVWCSAPRCRVHKFACADHRTACCNRWYCSFHKGDWRRCTACYDVLCVGCRDRCSACRRGKQPHTAACACGKCQ